MESVLNARLVVAPTSEPITIDEAKRHLRVDTLDNDSLDASEEEALIDSLIMAARQYIEERCWIALCTQTWRQYLTSWPAQPIVLNKQPVLAITSVKYRDAAGVTQTVAASVYTLTPESGMDASFSLAPNQAWPTVQRSGGLDIWVDYVCGYGEATAVPETIKAALKLMLGHLYENREAVVVGTIATNVPMAVNSLLALYEVR